jgi:NAD(P)-dependent dehydrogenase (short-subunit alcohol dehydrogenase family)
VTAKPFWGLRRFEGQVAIVTGGASGIGWAVATRLAAEGAQVWIADLKGRAGARSGEHPALLPLDMDVSDEAAVAAAVAKVIERHGRIDVVVNCAGIVLEGTAQQTSRAGWQRVLDVNLTGTFLLCRHTLPHMIERRCGAIVNVGSDAALVGQTGQAAYCASKGGVAQFTRAAALDGAPYGIRVNCVCPCFIDTPLLGSWVDSAADPAKARAEAAATQAIGRVGKPEEVAAAIAYLASGEANFVTGVVLPVDGGATVS